MGQQQILVLSLTIVLVSIAVYIGISIFHRSMRQSQIDLLVSHTVNVASEAVAWRLKGDPFLGGGGSYNNLSLKSLLTEKDRLPGYIALDVKSGNEVDVIAVSADFPELGVKTRIIGTEIVETVISYSGEITLPETPPSQ